MVAVVSRLTAGAEGRSGPDGEETAGQGIALTMLSRLLNKRAICAPRIGKRGDKTRQSVAHSTRRYGRNGSSSRGGVEGRRDDSQRLGRNRESHFRRHRRQP